MAFSVKQSISFTRAFFLTVDDLCQYYSSDSPQAAVARFGEGVELRSFYACAFTVAFPTE